MDWDKYGIYPEWHLSGKDFSSSELKINFPNLILGTTNEYTDIAKIGRLNGQNYGYGSTVIVVENKITAKLDWLLDFILDNHQKIRNMGVTEEILWIHWFGIQGNMELDKNLLSKIAKTELNTDMNYFFINES